MKKLVLFAVAAIALSFASCSNKSNSEPAPEAEPTATVEQVTEEVVAPVETDSAAEVVEEVVETEAPAN